MKPIFRDRVDILGVLVGVVRKVLIFECVERDTTETDGPGAAFLQSSPT